MAGPSAESRAERNTEVVAVLGGGNFGTVIANIIAARGHQVRLWMRDPEQVEDTRRFGENRRYLPGHALHRRVEATADLEGALTGAGMVFVAVPSASIREVARDMARRIAPGTLLISTTKGIEGPGAHAPKVPGAHAPESQGAAFQLMSDILESYCPNTRVGVLSGPNLAEEIARGDYTGTVVASSDADLRTRVQETLHSRSFRVYSNPDRYGVELAGALKNIYAIASGMAAALGAGQNTRAMLITRGLAEMSRFAVSQGANPLTFLGLAGVGDLMVTCASPLSRNHQLGYAVGQGATLAQAQEEVGKLAEGVNTIAVVHARARELGVIMPIVQGLHEILFEGRALAEVLVRLMLAEQRDDVAFVASTAGLEQDPS